MARIDAVARHFEAGEREKEIYTRWQEAGAFTAHASSGKKPYTIVMPPPNITGQLHIGHALDLSLQDTLIRQKRMQGYEALYLPGTDHASIATEVKIVEQLRREGLEKTDLGREDFLKRAWAWREKYGNRIIEQAKSLGISADWTRTRFTLDEELSKAVRHVFVKLYEEGLIYRGERLINWCPSCRTTISDAEVEHEEEPGAFWYIRYPLADGQGSVEIATTRPETLLGDTALAVNPGDERYRDLVGREVILPLVGRHLPIVADDYVKIDFGTGIVKITPAHDPNDFEVGRRHQLPIINIFNEDATINENGGKYAGMSSMAARQAIVEDLKAGGYLIREEKYVHQVGHCYRCHSIIEPRLSRQWFVKMGPLAEPALKAVADGDVRFVPERFRKIYDNWMENVRDWSISRQLWWGHRIPAWYCDDCGEMIVAEEAPTVCPHCGSKQLHQDEDCLDTWFSSALWPFSTLGWPDDTEDYRFFYPTDVLVTAYDIIFFWVARMIFSALRQTGQAPFHHVFIHGLVRDEQGRKMSKSLGNGVDPLEVVRQYGADALRYGLLNGVSPGNDTRYTTEKIEAGRNFINKIWNAYRFAVMNFDDTMDFASVTTGDLTREDRWILHELQNLISAVTDNFEQYELGLALAKVYSFLWDQFCDWYIEMVKPRLKTPGRSRLAAQFVLNKVLCTSLKLLHPFMPFATEDMWSGLLHEDGLLMCSAWPQVDPACQFPREAEETNALQEVLRAARNVRAEMNVPPKKQIHAIIVAPEADKRRIFEENATLLASLAGIQEARVQADDSNIPLTAISMTFKGGSVHIPLADLVDLVAEKERLSKESAELSANVERLQTKLANPGFTEHAPAAVVAKERNKLSAAEEALAHTRQRLSQLQGEAQ